MSSRRRRCGWYRSAPSRSGRGGPQICLVRDPRLHFNHDRAIQAFVDHIHTISGIEVDFGFCHRICEGAVKSLRVRLNLKPERLVERPFAAAAPGDDAVALGALPPVGSTTFDLLDGQIITKHALEQARPFITFT